MLDAALARHSGSTVYLVDDDHTVRIGLARVLRSVGLAPVKFSSADEFLASCDAESEGDPEPRCLVLDVRMGGMSGLELQDKLNDRAIDLPIIFLTGHGDIPMGVRAIKRGALDFLTKPVDDVVLIRAVGRALDWHATVLTKRDPLVRGRLMELTPREFEVMRWVLSGAPNKKIADALGIAVKTVKVHRGRVMRKMEVGSLAELVRLALEAGIEPVDSRG